MICAKNGVVALLCEYGCFVMTDAYLLGETLILRTTADRIYPLVGESVAAGRPQVTIHRIEHWFDDRANYGTMIVLPGDWEGDLP